MEVVVYDLGLSRQNIAEIKSWRNVRMMPFDLAIYPPHVGNLTLYAWKACVVKEAVEAFGCIFFLDAGMELRSSLSDVKDKMARGGAWFVTVQLGSKSSYLGSWMHPTTYKMLGMNPRQYDNFPSLAAGIMVSLVGQGWVGGEGERCEMPSPKRRGMPFGGAR